MVTFFGILVIPLSLASIGLIILQPVGVGTWSAPALITAFAMLVMIPLTLDEVVAMGQFVLKRRRAGESLWQVFWKGGTIDGGGDDTRGPGYPAPLRRMGEAGVWGLTLPPTLLASTAIGIWLMAIPDVLGLTGAASDSNHLVGSVIVVVAVIAMAEVARAGRYLNVALGLWVVVSPFVLGTASGSMTVTNVVVGLALIALSVRRGPVKERYGTAQRYVR